MKNKELVIAAALLLLTGIVAYFLFKKPKATLDSSLGNDNDNLNLPAATNEALNLVQKAGTYSQALNGDKALEAGSSGPEVKQIQQDLISMGAKITADGSWGPQTTSAYNAQYNKWGIYPEIPQTLNGWRYTVQQESSPSVPSSASYLNTVLGLPV